MKSILDVHTHSISSGHAYSTIQENVHEAHVKGLKYYGISDHGPIMKGAPTSLHFKNLRVIPDYIEGIRVLKGAEANVVDTNGKMDLNDAVLKRLDYVIASFHKNCYDVNNSLEENMGTYRKLCENPLVTIIGHPDDGRFPCDFDALAKLCKESNTIIEINNSSLSPNSVRENAHVNIPLILEACKKYGTYVILNSDAHISFDVGEISMALELLKAHNFPDDQVLNFNEEEFKKVFKIV